MNAAPLKLSMKERIAALSDPDMLIYLNWDCFDYLLNILVPMLLGAIIALIVWKIMVSAAFNSENKIIDPVAIPDSPLRTIVQQLSDKIDLLGLEDIKTKDQIKALRAADGVSREQTKYLTATVNKANFGS